MAPPVEKSLKRGQPSIDSNESHSETKKPRRSVRIKSLSNSQLPSPLETSLGGIQSETTVEDDLYESGNFGDDGSITPPSQVAQDENGSAIGIPSPRPSHQVHSYSQFSPRPQRNTNAPSQFQPPSSPSSAGAGIGSPPNDTQAFSQFLYPPAAPLAFEVEDEESEGIWGYLVPLSLPPNMVIPPEKERELGKALVLRRRTACPGPQRNLGKAANNGNITGRKGRVPAKEYEAQEKRYESKKTGEDAPAGGYLIGRHPECDRILPSPTISNRHCLIFQETKMGRPIAVLEDLSQNGTFVNDAVVGRNKRRELYDGDEISILDLARFVFRYSRAQSKSISGFKQQYAVQEQLGKGHFASVYLCVERSTGNRYAVKHFTKRSVSMTASQERSRNEGLQQEIAVLMGVSHPSLVCLKDTFDEEDGVYLVLELAPEGELFNLIVRRGKLTEAESRQLFVQLFQGVKYLHERNIVHRDIKPENILLVDQNLSIKLADFGLAKIIGEESFTTTLCGTPSYVAPEILTPTPQRRYTRAVDVWSLGVVLYIVLCGFPPFSDELCTASNPYSLSQQIKMGRFDYPSPYWDAVGDSALDLIDRMLCIDVDKRITIDECLSHPWLTGEKFVEWLQREHPDDLQNNGQYAGWGTNGAQHHNKSSETQEEYRPADLANVSVDSTQGLRSAMNALNFEKRKPQRERTLLSELNEVHLAKVVPLDPAVGPSADDQTSSEQQGSIKLWKKNPSNSDFTDDTAPSTPTTLDDKKQDSKGNDKTSNIRKKKEESPTSRRDPEAFVAVGSKGDPILFSEDNSIYAPVEAKERAQQISES